MQYIKQLDSIRAIAILFVLCNHTLPKDSALFKASNFVAAPDIFFTISGFLITALLFKDKNNIERYTTGKLPVFRNFFLKRALRIFPAYYLAIALDFALQPGSLAIYKSYLNFTANFEIFHNQSWGRLAHLWTMSIEQQFYLIWPFVIVFAPKRLLLPTLMLFVGVGLYSQHALQGNGFGFVLPQTCFDALGIGALLAWVVIYKSHLFGKVYAGLCVLAAASAAAIASKALLHVHIPFFNHRTLVAFIVVWLIAYFIHNEKQEGGRMGVVFNNKVLILIGKISYGIYLYHLVVFYHAYKPFSYLNRYLPFYQFTKDNHAYLMIQCTLLVFGLAWVSWKYFELPLYSLTKYFITKPKARREVAADADGQHVGNEGAIPVAEVLLREVAVLSAPSTAHFPLMDATPAGSTALETGPITSPVPRATEVAA